MVAAQYLLCNASCQSVVKYLPCQRSHPDELSKDPMPSGNLKRTNLVAVWIVVWHYYKTNLNIKPPILFGLWLVLLPKETSSQTDPPHPWVSPRLVDWQFHVFTCFPESQCFFKLSNSMIFCPLAMLFGPFQSNLQPDQQKKHKVENIWYAWYRIMNCQEAFCWGLSSLSQLGIEL